MAFSITYYDNIRYHRMDFINRDLDFFGNGVVATSDFPLTFPTTPNMTATIGQGRAWVDGYRIANDSNPVTINFLAADPTNPRIDIIQLGHDDVNSVAKLMVKQGVAAASPVEPNADPGFVKLYAINVAANATSISASNIIDRRGLVPLNVSATQISLGGSAGTNQSNTFNAGYTQTFNGSVTMANGFTSNVAQGTAPFQVTSTTKVTNLNADMVDGYSFNQSLKTTDSPTFASLTAGTLTANVAQGTAPLVVTSTTQVNNLNAAMVNGYSFNQSLKTTDSPTFAGVSASTFTSNVAQGTAPFVVTSSTQVNNLNAALVNGYSFNQSLKTTDSPTFAGVLASGNLTAQGGGFGTATLNSNSLSLARNGANYFAASTAGGYFAFNVNGESVGLTNSVLTLNTDHSMKSYKSTLDDGSGNATIGGNLTVNGVNSLITGYSKTAGTSQYQGNWAGGNHWGIGPNTSATDNTLRIGMTDSAQGWFATPSSSLFTLYVAGKLTSLNNTLDDGSGNMTVANTLRATSFNLGDYQFEKVFNVVFANGTANQKVDLILGNNTYWGMLEIEVTGLWNNQDVGGRILKVYSLGVNAGGTIHDIQSRVMDAIGHTANQFGLGEIVWDSTNNQYKIQMGINSSNGNSFSIRVRSLMSGTNYTDAFATALALSSIYTTDSSVLPTPVQNVHGKFITDNNTLDDGAGNITTSASINIGGSLQFSGGGGHIAPPSGGYAGFTNNAQNAWYLQVHDGVGSVTTLHNTLDDGNGNMTVIGNLNVDGQTDLHNNTNMMPEGTATSTSNYQSNLLAFGNSTWNGSAAVTNWRDIQMDTSSNLFITNISGASVFNLDNTGKLTLNGGLVTAKNTLDDGTGKSTFAGLATFNNNVYVSASGTATSTNDYWSSALNLYGSHWNGSAAVSNYSFIQGDPNGGFNVFSNTIGQNTPTFKVDQSGNGSLLGSLFMNSNNAGIEIGSQSAANSPYIDFHSSGAANDYNARIVASGGSTTTSINGDGDLNILSSTLHHNGNLIPDMSGFGSSMLFNGYQKLPSGLIIQWGKVSITTAGTWVTFTFPIAFPNALMGLAIAPEMNNMAATAQIGTPTTTSVQLNCNYANSIVHVIAIGN